MLKSTGKKGIIAGVSLMVFAILGVLLKQFDVASTVSLNYQQGIQLFLEGLGILGIRLALK